MHLLEIPPELRGLIYDLCFPPPQTYVQIVPYRTSLPACRLHLPVALYLVCKLITSELEPLPAKLRRLEFTYIIRGAVLQRGWRPEYGPKQDDDREHFPFIMRFAERVRLIGAGPARSRGRSLSSPTRVLVPGPECALKVLEIQPRAWRKWFLASILLTSLGPLTTHPDVAARLQLRLIRDTADPLEDVAQLKADLREYQADKERDGGEGPIWVDLADLDGPEKEVKTNLRKIEAWMKRFEAVRGADLRQRLEKKGPLGCMSRRRSDEDPCESVFPSTTAQQSGCRHSHARTPVYSTLTYWPPLQNGNGAFLDPQYSFLKSGGLLIALRRCVREGRTQRHERAIPVHEVPAPASGEDFSSPAGTDASPAMTDCAQRGRRPTPPGDGGRLGNRLIECVTAASQSFSSGFASWESKTPSTSSPARTAFHPGGRPDLVWGQERLSHGRVEVARLASSLGIFPPIPQLGLKDGTTPSTSFASGTYGPRSPPTQAVRAADGDGRDAMVAARTIVRHDAKGACRRCTLQTTEPPPYPLAEDADAPVLGAESEVDDASSL
ncbi:hypothetical protein C8R47DRAFT_1242147 [Mycena vitilis]|nr:hypothetical protein C8R47DRAFT_1242147 [Mycena vitilis]